MPRALLSSIVSILLFVAVTFGGTRAAAQSSEERFQDLFITAGYCTAFGAAVGTALLAWTEDPSAHLKYVAVGASLGFLGGSIIGSYVIFSPMLSDGTEPEGSTLTASAIPDRGLVIRPTYDTQSKSVTSIEGGLTLATF